MPHLKVKPFDISKIDINSSDTISFFAKADNSNDYLFGVNHLDEEFLLQLKLDKDSYLLKYDKVSRPLRVDIVKSALEIVSRELNLEILLSNITQKKVTPSSKYLKKIDEFEDISYPKDKVSVEVGFGSGRHILYQAQNNPDTLFIGLEIHTPSAQQLLKQIELLGLDNIWVVNYDARLFLEMLPSNLCTQIFVHFPVPWDKKPNRRVISDSFINESMRALKKGATLELRTDSHKYFWYSLERFFDVKYTQVEIRKNKRLEVTSKYEDRWIRQNKDIYDVFVESLQESDKKDNIINFEFETTDYNFDIFDGDEFKKAFVGDDFFVHFERVYTIDDKTRLIKCAFGSFERPEHKYLLIEDNKCRYFVSPPVKTSVNLLAHNYILAQFSK